MHATSLFATIVALSAAVSATPLSSRSANRKANEFSSGDWYVLLDTIFLSSNPPN